MALAASYKAGSVAAKSAVLLSPKFKLPASHAPVYAAVETNHFLVA
jgi:hypothetical protein